MARFRSSTTSSTSSTSTPTPIFTPVSAGTKAIPSYLSYIISLPLPALFFLTLAHVILYIAAICLIRHHAVGEATTPCTKPHMPHEQLGELRMMVDDFELKIKDLKSRLGTKEKQLVKPLMYLMVDMAEKVEEIMKETGGDKKSMQRVKKLKHDREGVEKKVDDFDEGKEKSEKGSEKGDEEKGEKDNQDDENKDEEGRKIEERKEGHEGEKQNEEKDEMTVNKNLGKRQGSDEEPEAGRGGRSEEPHEIILDNTTTFKGKPSEDNSKDKVASSQIITKIPGPKLIDVGVQTKSVEQKDQVKAVTSMSHGDQIVEKRKSKMRKS